MTFKNTFINDVTMFFIGAIIGIVLHSIIRSYIELNQIEDNRHLLLIGIFQLLCIASIARFLTNKLNMQGLFILGIVSSQELIITKLYPRHQNKK